MIDSLIVKLLQQTCMRKMHQNTFAPPSPAEGAYTLPGPSSGNQGVLLLTVMKKVTLYTFGPSPKI